MTSRWSEPGQAAERAAGFRRAWPLVVLALALMAGIALGRLVPVLWVWAPAALLAATGMGIWLWRGRDWPVRCWGLLAAVAIGASWFMLQSAYVGESHISRYLPAERSMIATVRGRVAGPPHLASAQAGPFGDYSYKPPTTLARLELTHLRLEGEARRVSGAVLVKISGADTRLRPGQRIRATGWLSRIDAPRNPGGSGYRQWLAQHGMAGRISLPSPANYEVEAEAAGGWLTTLTRAKHALREAARSSLALGIAAQSEADQLLGTVLLGERTGESSELREQFRDVGLAHLLAISGAHLGILLGLVWLVARVVGLGPRAVTIILLGVVGFYLLIVPARVPILRASLMAGLILGGRGFGRQGNALAMLALAAIIVLMWRPIDLFSPGFQLSFGAVTALILFTKPVSHWLWRPNFIDPEHTTLGQTLMRRAVDYVAVCLVALLVVSPIVAYHFHAVHPLSAVMSVLALPAFAAVLGLGYLKMAVGLIWPSASLILSGPAAWAGTSLATLVAQANAWPGTHVRLLHQPSLGWVIAMLSVTAALLAGRFRRRRTALVGVVIVMLGWTVIEQKPYGLTASLFEGDEAAVTLRMLAVDDGSCYLISSGRETVMFDCGSRTYLDVARKTILPTLRQLDVGRIDTLVLSHPDLDHFSGALTLARQWPVGRVVAPPPLLRDAAEFPHGPTGHLRQQLRKTGEAIEPVHRGWSMTLGEAELTALWPPGDYRPSETNDGSLVLAVDVAGRRLLLNGDVQETAIAKLMASETALDAAVTDVPHHGSFIENAGAWLEAVEPEVVLQSSGPIAATGDDWQPLLTRRGIPRLISERTGMVTVRVDADGGLEVTTFRERGLTGDETPSRR